MRRPIANATLALLLCTLTAVEASAQDTRVEITAPDAGESVTLAGDRDWTSFFETLDVDVIPGSHWSGTRQLQLVVTGKRGDRYFSPTVTSRVMVDAAEASRDAPLSGGRFVGPGVVSTQGIWGAWSGGGSFSLADVHTAGTEWRPGSAWIPGAAGGPGDRWVPEELSAAEGVRDASGGIFVYAVFADAPVAEQPVVRPLALTAAGGGGPAIVDTEVVGDEARYDVGGVERYADDPVPGSYEGSVYPEVGRISPLADDWRTVSLDQSFEEPVVIAGPPTHRGGNPGVLRLDSVGPESFQARFREWRYRQTDHDDTRHNDETAYYLAIESGRSEMVDNSVWVAGTFELGGERSWETVHFDEELPGEPKLFLTPQTANGGHPVAVRARNVGAGSFEAAFFEEEDLGGAHVPETVGYLAVYSDGQTGTATVNRNEVDYRLLRETVTDDWKRVGPVRIHLEEETSNDPETSHTQEEVDVLILGPSDTDRFFAQQVSSHGSDPAALRMSTPDLGTEEPSEIPGETRTAVIGLSSFTITHALENNGDDPGVVVVGYRGRVGETADFFRTSHTTENLPHADGDTYIYRVAGDAPGATYVQADLEPWELFGVCFAFFERDKSSWSVVKDGIDQAIEAAEDAFEQEMGAVGQPDFTDASEQNAKFIARTTLGAAERALESFNPWDHKSQWNKPFKNNDDYVGTACAQTMNVPGLGQSEIASLSDFVFHGTEEGHVVGGSKHIMPIFRAGDPTGTLSGAGRWDMNMEVHLGLEEWRQAGFPFDASY